MVRNGDNDGSRGGGRGGGRGMMRMMGGGNNGNRGGGRMGGGGMRRGNNMARGGARGGGFNNDDARPLGPVEELYDDIYDDLSGASSDNNISPLAKLFSGNRMGGSNGNINGPTSKLNIGIPSKTYLKVTKLNTKYDSYRYSMIKATKGKATAARELRESGFEGAFVRAFGSLGDLTVEDGTALLTLERDFLMEGNELLKELADLTREITNAAVLDEVSFIIFYEFVNCC